MKSTTGWMTILTLAAALTFNGCSDDGDTPDNDASTDAVSSDGTGGGPLTAQQLMDACLRASACKIKTYPVLLNCVEAYYKLYASQGLAPIYSKIYHCVNAAAGDCSATAACFKRGAACDSGFKAKCSGTVGTSCDLIDKRTYAVDCADANLKCMVKTGGTIEATCAPASCTSTSSDSCSGDQLYNCASGVFEIKDCAVEGLKCAKLKKGYECKGEVDTYCNPGNYPLTCKGNVAWTCVNDAEHHVDCSKNKTYQTTCKNAVCVTTGTACDKNLNRCKGDTLEVCLDGKWVAVDCGKLGLGVCYPAVTGANCSSL